MPKIEFSTRGVEVDNHPLRVPIAESCLAEDGKREGLIGMLTRLGCRVVDVSVSARNPHGFVVEMGGGQ